MSDNLSQFFLKTLLGILLFSGLISISIEAKEAYRYTSQEGEKRRTKEYCSIRLEFDKSAGKKLFSPGDKVVLYRAKWGNELPVDSAKISKEGVAVIYGKNRGAGEYTVKKGNRTLMELFISDENKQIKESYSIVSDEQDSNLRIIHKKGSVENALFMNLQNYIFTILTNNTNPKIISAAIDSICLEVSQRCHGSMLDIMCRISMNPNSEKPSYIRDNFPFKDQRIIYTRFAKSTIENYLQRIRLNTNDAIEFLADDLISAASESLKPYIASTIYHKFEESDIMGQEAVAIYVAKKYFEKGKLIWPAEEEEFLANAFVHMNENSLIGMKSPAIAMKDTSGYLIPLDSIGGKYKVLYFYSADCKTCMIETPKLVKFLNEYSGDPISVYAVYTDSNREHWIKYIKTNFNITNNNVKWFNVWDPSIESNFPLLYGVISTPQLYLIDTNKIIIGRRLRSDSLKELLRINNNNK